VAETKHRAEVEALSAHLLPDIRRSLYGQNLSAQQIQAEIQRKVGSETTVPTNLIPDVTLRLAQELIRKSQFNSQAGFYQ
jgi:hypothetical protein